MKGKENQGMIFFLSILLAKILKHPFSHHVYFKENYKMKKKKKKKMHGVKEKIHNCYITEGGSKFQFGQF